MLNLHSLRQSERLPVSVPEAQAALLMEEVEFSPDFKGVTDRLICELLYSTGMRRQELLNLRETDIAWGQRLLRVLGKGNKERLLPLAEALVDTLRDYVHAKQSIPDVDRTTCWCCRRKAALSGICLQSGETKAQPRDYSGEKEPACAATQLRDTSFE
jgi:site-specific recombinase XerD